ncbi:MAG: hypothetical protein IPG63_12530 [Xanthomonadales bacterium]|nr:hypothetical protein [Xanthomonadales bacterium]MBK7145265.1 hypothetical protein [Xanthomonadales bacterium]MCC6559741.1 hypothetical protein [Xanthomonadales bacterium]
MHSVKQIVHDIAEQLPDEATFDDAMYALYVRQKLQASIETAARGELISQADIEREFLGDAG